jgi:hypothetical protein
MDERPGVAVTELTGSGDLLARGGPEAHRARLEPAARVSLPDPQQLIEHRLVGHHLHAKRGRAPLVGAANRAPTLGRLRAEAQRGSVAR